MSAYITIWQGAALWNQTKTALNLHGYQGGYRCDLIYVDNTDL